MQYFVDDLGFAIPWDWQRSYEQIISIEENAIV